MANTRKFSVKLRAGDNAKTFTISNPKEGISITNVNAFRTGYNSAYNVTAEVMFAKYIDTSETYVLPASEG